MVEPEPVPGPEVPTGPPPTNPNHQPSRAELLQLSADTAAGLGVPARMLVGASIAESGGNPRATRFGHPDGTEESQYGVNLMREIAIHGPDTVSGAWDGTGVEKTGRQAFAELMARCAVIGGWDVSFGLGQFTPQGAPEFDRFGMFLNDRTGTYENIKRLSDYFYDPANAVWHKGEKLAGYYYDFRRRGYSEDDAIIRALNKYNWPRGDGAPAGGVNSGNEANYRRAIAEAVRLGY